MNPQVNGAIKRLAKVAEEVKDELDVINKYTYDALAKCMEDIETKQQEMEKLEVTFAEKERAQKVDLELRMKEHEKGLLNTLAGTHGYELVVKDDYKEVLSKVDKAEKLKEQAVAIATSGLKKTLETDFRISTSETTIKIERLNAQLEQAKQQELFLQKEVERLTSELAAAGERMVKIAEAKQSSTVNVGK